MKPLVISLDYPPNSGGISRLVSGLVETMDKNGHVPSVVTMASPSGKKSARPDVPHYEVSKTKGPRDFHIIRHIHRHPSSEPILASVWNPEATLAICSGKRRVSVMAHGNEVMAYGIDPIKSRLRRLIFERCKTVICNSRHTEALVRNFAPSAITTVLNPPVDAAKFQPKHTQNAARAALAIPQAHRIILTVARLDPMKGHETALRALARMPKTHLEKSLYVIAGTGPMRCQLETLVSDLGLKKNVRFAGQVSDEDLALYYAAADLFVLCSLTDKLNGKIEGFGMALTEAQAAGLPVIATNSGGIPDAVTEGDGGWLIEERDTSALSNHFIALAESTAIYVIQGRRGQARVRRDLTWDAYAQNVLKVI